MNNESRPLLIAGLISIVVSVLLTGLLIFIGFFPSIWNFLLPLGLLVTGIVLLIIGVIKLLSKKVEQ